MLHLSIYHLGTRVDLKHTWASLLHINLRWSVSDAGDQRC